VRFLVFAPTKDKTSQFDEADDTDGGDLSLSPFPHISANNRQTGTERSTHSSRLTSMATCIVHFDEFAELSRGPRISIRSQMQHLVIDMSPTLLALGVNDWLQDCGIAEKHSLQCSGLEGAVVCIQILCRG
jgi:hypothetical protein